MPKASDLDVDADADAIQFNLPLGGQVFGTGVDIPFQFDLPGFGLDVNGGFGVAMTWSYDFGFGLSVKDFFYLTTNDKTHLGDPEVKVEIGARIGRGRRAAHP